MDRLKEFVAGGCGGVAQCIVGHPADTLKVKMVNQPEKYQSMMQTLKLIIKEDGAAALYRGVQSPLIGMTAMNSTLFFANGLSQKLLNITVDTQSVAQAFTAGAFAGAAVCLVESPVDLFKCQLQTHPARFSALPQTALAIFREGGVRGLYQGYSAANLRNVPANALYFGVYHWTKTLLKSEKETLSTMASWKLLLAGGAGGVAYWLPIYPIDVVKTKMQSDHTAKALRVYPTFMKTAQLIMQKDGLRGFTRGMTPCLVRSFPANAATFYAYEVARSYLGI